MLIALGLTLALAMPLGCLDIDGGAVEVAWVIRTSDQKAADCQDNVPPIHRIRLKVAPVDEPDRDLCAEGLIGECDFECGLGGGTTPFNIPEGAYFFGIQPLTADGSPILSSDIAVSSSIRRSIVTGDLTDLGIWQLVILVGE
ncbi:MAG: hypothetical protein ABI333_22445 [bacterium]